MCIIRIATYLKQNGNKAKKFVFVVLFRTYYHYDYYLVLYHFASIGGKVPDPQRCLYSNDIHNVFLIIKKIVV